MSLIKDKYYLEMLIKYTSKILLKHVSENIFMWEEIWILRFIPMGLILRERHISFKFCSVKAREFLYGKGK